MKETRINVFSGLPFFIFIFLFGCAAGPPPIAIGPTPAPTEVIRYAPAEIPAKERPGHCWTDSIAASRKGAWRCMTGNEIYDPCFELGAAVVCDANPADGKQGFRLVLEKPLPPPGSAIAEPEAGWLIQLVDGRICNRATGARGMVAGGMTTYYCTTENPDESAVVLGELKTGTIWTAEIAVVERIGGKIREQKTVPVLRVWQ